MATAFGVLSSSLEVTAAACESHTHLEIRGIGSPQTVHALAVYLVGSIAQCIHADLEIRAALFDDATRDEDLLSDIIDVIGDDDAEDRFRTMSRDPWMWEAISHLVIHLARSKTAFHPSGRILAKTPVKYDVNDHGLDLIGIYESTDLGITAGECKAYLTNPTDAITDAANRLREVDDSSRDSDIRAAVNQLRTSLSEAQCAKLGGSFWRNERAYYPFVCCDAAKSLQWNRNRQALRTLAIPVSHKLLVPVSIPHARDVFDQIATLMRDYVSTGFTS